MFDTDDFESDNETDFDETDDADETAKKSVKTKRRRQNWTTTSTSIRKTGGAVSSPSSGASRMKVYSPR